MKDNRPLKSLSVLRSRCRANTQKLLASLFPVFLLLCVCSVVQCIRWSSLWVCLSLFLCRSTSLCLSLSSSFRNVLFVPFPLGVSPWLWFLFSVLLQLFFLLYLIKQVLIELLGCISLCAKIGILNRKYNKYHSCPVYVCIFIYTKLAFSLSFSLRTFSLLFFFLLVWPPLH